MVTREDYADIEDYFLCWENKITEKELDKYNELE